MYVHEIATAAEVTPETVRYYTRLGLFVPERDKTNGYKIYDSEDLRRLKFIRNARRLGFGVKDIIEILRQSEAGTSPCPFVREMIVRRIVALDERHRVELELKARMKAAAQMWEDVPDGIPDGDSICHLIEAVGEDP